jgi:hypothetical protein
VFPWFAEVNIPGLAELREHIVEALRDAGFTPDERFPDYHPHITLAYVEEGKDAPAVELQPRIIDITEVTVAIAGSRRALSLQPRPSTEEAWNEREQWLRDTLGEDAWSIGYGSTTYRPFVKSVVHAERRFTLGPWYIPDTEDAHGEWTDADVLQQALWDYVDSGYRGIHLQHSPDIVAGRWVEAMSLPWAIEVPIIDINGQVAAHVYPAGTVMLGVVWEPWAWELVKAGKVTGYSIGGYSSRTDEDVPDPDESAPRMQLSRTTTNDEND